MDKKKIFIIEDEAAILYALEAQLCSAGYAVDKLEGAPTINSVLDKIKLSAADYIILDLVLPQVDGFELLKAIKADEETTNTTVFVFTNFSDADTKTRCGNLGAEYYFIKSEYNIEQFVDKFRRITDNLNEKT